MYKPVRDVRIALCETFASSYARHSHRFMRDVRIALCETFASPYARHSHRFMRDVRIALCETFASPYARYSFRLNRDVGYGRDKMFIQCWRSSLSKSDDKAQSVSRYKINNVRSGSILRFMPKRTSLFKCCFLTFAFDLDKQIYV